NSKSKKVVPPSMEYDEAADAHLMEYDEASDFPMMKYDEVVERAFLLFQDLSRRKEKQIMWRFDRFLDTVSARLNRNFEALTEKMLKGGLRSLENAVKRDIRGGFSTLGVRPDRGAMADQNEIIAGVKKCFLETVVPAIENSLHEIIIQMRHGTPKENPSNRQMKILIDAINSCEFEKAAIMSLKADDLVEYFARNVNVKDLLLGPETVYALLAKTVDLLPTNDPLYLQYIKDLLLTIRVEDFDYKETEAFKNLIIEIEGALKKNNVDDKLLFGFLKVFSNTLDRYIISRRIKR
ncbi:hypothetical protein EQH57_0129, partial [Dictyocoela roeselum]